MTDTTAIGSVSEIWRFPVKSMLGEKLDRANFSAGGIPGDRAYALIDTETGKVVSAKNVRQYPDLFKCKASFPATPSPDSPLPPVRIDLPNGTIVTSSDADVDYKLSAFFGRSVTLAAAAPQDFTIDQYHPDMEDVDPRGHRDTVAEQKLGSAFFNEAGMPSPVPEGAFFDLFPVTVLTTGTLNALGQLSPDCLFDARRFRMNVIVDTHAEGFVENDWVERELQFGDAVKLQVTMPDPRCVMTTLAQEELPQDNDILRTMVKHNRLPIADAGRFPCAGVYAVVVAPGDLSTGDAVHSTA